MTQQLLCKAAQHVVVIAALAASGIAANAQTPFPTGTIRFVAPFSASTPPDIISRIVAKELSESENWRAIVENRPGGVTTIAANDVLMQSADGHNLYAMTIPSVAAPSLVPNISYRFDTDFEPVIKASVSYNVLVVNPSVPANSVAELVALLKSQPDKLTFSSGGFGTPAHLIGEQFKLQTGARAQHVPYAQFPQAIGDLLNGTNAFMFITMLQSRWPGSARPAGRRLFGGIRPIGQFPGRALEENRGRRRNQGSTLVASGFRVTLLGTGSPIPRPDRFGPSTLIEAGDQTILIDAGRGAPIRISQLGIPLGRIDALLLTHTSTPTIPSASPTFG